MTDEERSGLARVYAKEILGRSMDDAYLYGNDLRITLCAEHVVKFDHLQRLSQVFRTTKINFEWDRGDDLSDVTPGPGPSVWIDVLDCTIEGENE
jgi:hypothetical protein